MQRDEFLPLRVIRQELATGDFTGRRPSDESQKRRAASVGEAVTSFTRDDLLGEADVGDQFLRELQDFGIVAAKRRDGREAYDETDLEIVRAAAELSKFGVGGRNLRVFQAPRPTARRRCSKQLLGAQLRSRSQARRKEAVENLESLAAVCGHLKHLLLVRDLRRLKASAE